MVSVPGPYAAIAAHSALTAGLHVLLFSDNVVLLGTVPDDELPSWYTAADVLAFPSTKEGWGLAVLEAMSAGLPVVASDLPVFREYLRPARTPSWCRWTTRARWPRRSARSLTTPRWPASRGRARGVRPLHLGPVRGRASENLR